MADVNIEIRENGPLRVTGPFTITDKDGKEYSIPEGQWVSFCRCGQSEKKPFCDSSHRDCGFEAESAAS
ncbi:MAG: CDGSH iron-sulfur domain-containing protein [Chloroflexi bacterium]|nr:CDGSH iron-sulfur domain-containing protein [Chloroflexota bacterium]